MDEEKNDLPELNNILFDTMRRLKNKECDIYEAEQTSNLATNIIEIAKVRLKAAIFYKDRVKPDKQLGFEINEHKSIEDKPEQ